MGRHSQVDPLLRQASRSEVARERVKVVLLTLSGQWSVSDALERLGISRTRFGVLRRQMLQGALLALEPRPRGRPAKPETPQASEVLALRAQNADLRRELRRVRTQLELAESPAAAAVRWRLHHKLTKDAGR